MKKITTLEMEIVLNRYFDCRRNIIVPNVSWGMYLNNKSLHECDLLICTGNNYLYEVEIKITKPDLVADKKKSHGHRHPSIKRLYFAYPNYLEDADIHVPERAGIITIGRTDAGGFGWDVRRTPINTNVKRISDSEKLKLAHLGAMRIWSLKNRLLSEIKKAIDK